MHFHNLFCGKDKVGFYAMLAQALTAKCVTIGVYLSSEKPLPKN
jgi:hypothetical protein